MPDDRTSKIKACRARIARYNRLIAGFSREARLALGSRLLSQAERERYLAAVKRVLLSLAESRQMLEGALAAMGERLE
jgi:hypothetical protein